MRIVRIDAHAHLYDCYSSERWCRAAFKNLGGGGEALPLVIVVDREKQNSLARLRREVPSFAAWRELGNGGAGEITFETGSMVVVQGVQYVTRERMEVLGLGVERSVKDGLGASDYISVIQRGHGVPCLPWSPGKWLGARGQIVRGLLAGAAPRSIRVGDISINFLGSPLGSLLRCARGRGASVICGTDPLPVSDDEAIVGSFGSELVLSTVGPTDLPTWEPIKALLLSGSAVSPWGRRSSPVGAAAKFIRAQLREL